MESVPSAIRKHTVKLHSSCRKEVVRARLTDHAPSLVFSYVRPATLVRTCDDCNFGTYGGRCIICGSPGESASLVANNGVEERQEGGGEVVSSTSLERERKRELTSASFGVVLAGISDAYYCTECTRLEKDRDGCPKIVNLGASRTDLFYERK